MTSSSEFLRYGFGDSDLGAVLVAESGKGVAALFLGDDPARLLGDLRHAFPKAELALDPASLAGSIAKAVALANAPHLESDLKLDLRGSPLELAVWDALTAIPAGETRSYGQLVRKLTLPATAQDVGAACAANRIAIAIPCHRVVKADGSLAGYRWGVWRKRRLIRQEGLARPEAGLFRQQA
jgi:AraC family transcriptional regulator of adaptative response/methylated-DNA-[protein]-cysteine methyltransferase